MNRKHLTGLVIGIWMHGLSSLFGQQSHGLFFMHQVPQANMVNPALATDCPWVLGIPALGSVHGHYHNTAFRTNRLWSESNDTLYWSPDRAIQKLQNREAIDLQSHVALLYFGIHTPKSYFTFSLTERATAYQTFRGKAIETFWYGNAPTAGKPAPLSGTRSGALHYRELALGWSFEPAPQWRIGIKPKFLWGLSAIYTSKLKGELQTTLPVYALQASLDAVVMASGPFVFTQNNLGELTQIRINSDVSAPSYLLSFKNPGLALDLGFVHQYDDRTTIAGSLLDLGFIHFSKDAQRIQANGNATFDGPVQDGNWNTNEYWDSLADSLIQQLNPTIRPQSFWMPLTPQAYLGATRQMTRKISVGVAGHLIYFPGKLKPSMAAMAQWNPAKWVTGQVNYSIQNGSWTNVGAGFFIRAGAFSMFATTDHLPALFHLTSSRTVQLRFGFALTPGCSPSKNQIQSHTHPGAIPCEVLPANAPDNPRSTRRSRR